MVLEKRVVIFRGSAADQPGTSRMPSGSQRGSERPNLAESLRERSFQVYEVEKEEDLADVLRYSHPDAAVLAGTSSMPALARLITASQAGTGTAIIVVWPGISPADAAALLDMGADHVVISYQPDWLAAQLRACLRRFGSDRSAPSVIDLGHLRIDLQKRQVQVSGRDVALTPTEFSVLRVLAERPGTVLPSGEIMQQVLGVRIMDSEAQDLLKVHIHRLRQKLEPGAESPRFIRTVRGHGYMYQFERRSRERTPSPLAETR
jgi:DNA-binding response OmpR family regulator